MSSRTLTNFPVRESPPMTSNSPGKPLWVLSRTVLDNTNYSSTTETYQPSHTAHAGSATRPPCRGELSNKNP